MILTTLHPITSSLLKLEPSSLTSNNGDSLWQDNSNIIDTEKEWRVSVDVPGVKAGDINIKVEGGILHISGIRKFESSEGQVVKKLKFSKSFQLPAEKYGETAIEPQKLEASLTDGVLVLRAPKKPKPEPVTISITINKTGKEVSEKQTIEQSSASATNEKPEQDPKKVDSTESSTANNAKAAKKAM